MSVLVIDGLKCTLIASHADPWWVTVSMPTGQTDRRKPDRVTLRFPLSAANVITWRSSSYLSRIKSNLIIRKLVLYNLQAGYERGNFVPSVVWLLTVRYVRAHWQLYTCSQNCLKSEHFHSATVLQNVHSADSRLLKTHLVHKSCFSPRTAFTDQDSVRILHAQRFLLLVLFYYFFQLSFRAIDPACYSSVFFGVRRMHRIVSCVRH